MNLLALFLVASQASAPAVAPAELSSQPDKAPKEEAPNEEASKEASKEAPNKEAPKAPPEEVAPVEREPPFVEDLAVAAGSPTTPPMVTAIVDRPERAELTLYFRAPGALSFNTVVLAAGENGLFLGRLPSGTQTTGFEYYLLAKDKAHGAESALGSPDKPFVVAPAREGTLERLKRERFEAAQPDIHPGWVMGAMGIGILAGAASGGFFYDLSSLNLQVNEIDSQLAEPGLNNDVAEQLRLAREQRVSAATGDLVFGAVTGVVAVAGLATGIGLMIAAASE